MKSSTRNLVLCSLFAAMTAVFAQISIVLPFTPVPINFGPFIVLLSGALLGSRMGATSMIVYILIGAVGMPVFANFSAGVGKLAGPTGGYIVSYILVAFVTGYMIEKLGNKLSVVLLSMTVGMIICYVCGTAWFMVLTKNNLVASLGMCVFPFIPGDIFKIVAGAILSNKLYPALSRQFA